MQKNLKINLETLKNVKKDLVFTQSFTIGENISRADVQLELLCDLQSDSFYTGRTETGITLFQVAAKRTIPKLRTYNGIIAVKYISLQTQLLQHKI